MSIASLAETPQSASGPRREPIATSDGVSLWSDRELALSIDDWPGELARLKVLRADRAALALASRTGWIESTFAVASLTAILVPRRRAGEPARVAGDERREFHRRGLGVAAILIDSG